jgi:DNA-binding SARP family transcriptional activator/Tfp pilus assembly protein PilF
MGERRQSSVMGNVKTAQNRHLQPPGTGLEIRFFGPMTAQIDGKTIAIPSKKTRALLAYLMQREGVEIARTSLTGLLWGERSEAQARASLRQSLSELRGLLGEAADALVATKESITWTAGMAWVDTRALETAAKSEDSARLDEAASLFTGEFLEGLSIDEAGFDEWLTSERERFRLAAASMYARLMQSAEQHGRLEEAITHGLKLLNIDPLQEHVYRALMRLYAAQGRPDAALAQYERCERELSSQLGVRPDAETEALAKTIRADRRKGAPKPETRPALPLPDKPSVTVLPFANLSSEREHGFFAAGLTQDIIAALSRIKELIVVSSGASQLSLGPGDLVRELGVRFILEGSVRAAGSRIRVTAHLIDGLSGGHVWAERYEGELGDIFLVQDQITQAIALAMRVKLTSGDMARFWEGQTRNLRAWEKMVAAQDAFLRFSRVDNATARQLLEEAIEIDPNYTGAMVLHGQTFWWDARFNKDIDPEYSLRLAEEDSRKALALNPGLGIAFMLKAGIAWLRDQHDEAVKFAKRAVDLAPSDSHSIAFLAMLYMYGGEYEKSIAALKFAMRLCPQYPPWYTYYLAFNHLWTDNFTAALELGELYLRQEPDEPFAYTNMATILALQHRKKEAAAMIARLRERFPDFGMAEMRLSQRYRDHAKLEKVVNALREAGLPG